MLRGTELCEERLWEMGRSRLEKKGLWGADSRSAGATRGAQGHTAGYQTQTAMCRCDQPREKVFPGEDSQAPEQGHRN